MNFELFFRRIARVCGLTVVLLLPFAASAQWPGQDLGKVSPRGLDGPASPASAPAVSTGGASPSPQTPITADRLLGEDPAGEFGLPMFGQQIFRPGSLQGAGAGFNSNYTLAPGDRVILRMWGAFNHEAAQTIDAQGNVFVPNVGPVRLAGVPNGQLNDVVRQALGRVYRSNVGVYAALESSQPVRVFVTGAVRAPGQYAGAPAESVLGYLSRAGGVDPLRGSYVDIKVLRGERLVGTVNLYRFLLEGRLDAPPLRDGDTLVVGPRQSAAGVAGEVFNAFAFEFPTDRISLDRLLELARPKPGATHVSVVRRSGQRQLSEYHPLERAHDVVVNAGDFVSVVSDRAVGTILVRLDGAHQGSRVLALPYGSRLKDAIAQLKPTPQAQPGAVQLYRQSVARQQKEMLEVSLRSLETHALTGRSATIEEANLRAREAELITRFVERARSVQPRGQVVLANREGVDDTLLEDGDVLFVPERSSVVMVHGEVNFPSAVAYDSSSSVADYLKFAGGTTQQMSDAQILLMRQDGSIVEGRDARPQPGDQIFVLPKVGARRVEVTRGITQILYQIAVAAKVVFGL